MDAKELKQVIDKLVEELPKALLENKGFEQMVVALCRISSYLVSEQDKRKALDLKIDKHQLAMLEFEKLIWGDKADIENKPGLAHEWMAARKQRNRMERWLMAISLAVMAPIIGAIFKALGLHL